MARNRGPRSDDASGVLAATGSSLIRRRNLRRTWRAGRPSTHLAVEDCPDEDHEPLEEVLPTLTEAEEHRGIQNLNAEPGAHQRADEGASPPEQARPAEDDRGYGRQGIARALSRIADAELGQQDDRAEEREE